MALVDDALRQISTSKRFRPRHSGRRAPIPLSQAVERSGEQGRPLYQNIMSKQQKHRSATEVTVAPLEERGAFEEFVFKHWAKGVALFVVVAAGIWVSQSQQEAAERVDDMSWTDLGEKIAFIEGTTSASPQALEVAAADLSGTLAEPWASALIGPAYASAKEYESALSALADFEARFPGHILANLDIESGGDAVTSPVALFRERVEALESFRNENPGFFSNPEPAADSPRVRLTTTAGDIDVALYPEFAPNHCENFLERVDAGLYDGTKFHRTVAGFMIQGGDPNTVDGDPSTWGLGGGDETQPQEFSDLLHFEGYLAMAKRGNEIESSKAQFYLTLAPAHNLDNVHTVFGKVESGMDVVQAIGTAAIEDGTVDRPAAPVTISSASRL